MNSKITYRASDEDPTPSWESSVLTELIDAAERHFGKESTVRFYDDEGNEVYVRGIEFYDD